MQLKLVFEPKYLNISNYLSLQETIKRAIFVSTKLSPNDVTVAKFQQSTLCGISILSNSNSARALSVYQLNVQSNDADQRDIDHGHLNFVHKGIQANPVYTPTIISFSVVSNVPGYN